MTEKQNETDLVMGFFKRNWAIWSSLFFILLIPVIFYIFNFNDGLSFNNSDWGSFGSYIGGVLTPLLTFATIIILIISNRTQAHLLKEQIISQKNQIDILENEKKMVEVEKGIFEVLKFVKYFMEKPVPKSVVLDYYQTHHKEYSYSYDDITNCIRGVGATNSIILEESNIFSFFNSAIKRKGLVWVKEELIMKNSYALKSQLNSFKSQCDYLIGLVIILKEKGTDINVLKYYLSTIYSQYDLMGKLGLVAEENLINLKLFQNFKSEWTKLSFNVSDIFKTVESSQKVEFINGEHLEDQFEFMIKLNGKDYGISNGSWKEIINKKS